jgi:hypothetical protein
MSKLKFKVGDRVRVVAKRHSLYGKTFKIKGHTVTHTMLRNSWRNMYIVEVGSNWHDKSDYYLEAREIDFAKPKEKAAPKNLTFGIGDKIQIAIRFDYGMGSGSQGTTRIEGKVTELNMFEMYVVIVPTAKRKAIKYHFSNILGITKL